MGRTDNRADHLLLDTGSIMTIVFGGLSIAILTILGIGLLFQFTSNLVLFALVISALLALNGLGLIYLSSHV